MRGRKKSSILKTKKNLAGEDVIDAEMIDNTSLEDKFVEDAKELPKDPIQAVRPENLMQIVQEVREATDSWLGWLWHGFFSWAAWMVLTLLVWFCCYGTPNLKYDQYNRSLPDKMLETDHFGSMDVGWI